VKGPGPLEREGGREGGREGRKEKEALPPFSLLRLKADGGTVDHSFLNSLGADNRERAWSAAHERCLWGKEGREVRKESILHLCLALSHSRLFFQQYEEKQIKISEKLVFG